MPKTISFHNGSEWSRGHNIRDERYTSKQEHINSSLSANNVIICDMPVRKAYDEIFGAAVKEYNSHQKRNDRRIDNYYDKIKKDKRKHPVYECIVQIGDRNDTGNNAELEKQALIQYAQTWSERNPNLFLVGAYVHCDEPDGTVHLHCDYIPVAQCSRGMRVQNSLDKALQQQGLKSKNINQTAQMSWQNQERNALLQICEELNIDVQLNQEKTKGRTHLTTQEYKAEQQRIEQELEPLKEELQEYTDIKRDFKTISVKPKKIPLTKNVIVSASELQEIESQAKSYRAIRRQIDSVESKEKSLADKEKKLQELELQLDTRAELYNGFEEIKKALEQAENEVATLSSELSETKSQLNKANESLSSAEQNVETMTQKYQSMKKAALEDCGLIKDLMLAIKMLINSDSDSPYMANLSEKQTNLIKGIVNTAKTLLFKRGLKKLAEDVANNNGISDAILSEIEKLPPSQNQPLFSKDRVKSGEFNPTSDQKEKTINRSRGRGR